MDTIGINTPEDTVHAVQIMFTYPDIPSPYTTRGSTMLYTIHRRAGTQHYDFWVTRKTPKGTSPVFHLLSKAAILRALEIAYDEADLNLDAPREVTATYFTNFNHLVKFNNDHDHNQYLMYETQTVPSTTSMNEQQISHLRNNVIQKLMVWLGYLNDL